MRLDELAREFAGIAAREILQELGPLLPESRAAEAGRLVADCVRAAILSTVIRLAEGKQPQ